MSSYPAGGNMNRVRRILDAMVPDGMAARRRKRKDARWKILNLTRESILADRAEVANHGAERSKGLLGRAGLAPGEGLWILPCEAVHTFFMRFPIDLVYVDRKKRVRKVRSDVVPWRLSACLSAHSVVELPRGTVRATRTSAGDRLEFSPAESAE